jgi:hypothetical protein
MTNQIHPWRPGIALLACIILLLLCIAPASADVIVYYQPPTLNGALYASQNDVSGFGNFASLYDDFVIFPQVPFYLNDVHWYGGYFNPPAQGHIRGWTISIYADAALAPGGLLWTEHFANDASESFIGNFGGFPFYAYHEDDIGSLFSLRPNTRYWLSLVPDVSFPPQWGWGTGVLGDGIAYQTFFGTTSRLSADLAFDISGNPVPEPTSLLLMGSGALGLAGVLRRRLLGR